MLTATQINAFCEFSALVLYTDENFLAFALPKLHLVLYVGPYYMRVFMVNVKSRSQVIEVICKVPHLFDPVVLILHNLLRPSNADLSHNIGHWIMPHHSYRSNVLFCQSASDCVFCQSASDCATGTRATVSESSECHSYYHLSINRGTKPKHLYG